ncbi:rhomboid family intramembrane serine protease [Tropicimonas sp. TH_r6]|uniref:rhomboid family intramembrane serine protease n=1 Tax=Tropicimonas sp. TH_r6 TaxID=3082085 RepID=UPI002954E7FB|nr:rhomboid family intramembrane serine protease [Tropicimonas sp. TH_r6]MDV7144535.1 rhomboid family intramembrane serine protease [Tropicimonas sp. TH_r6]
MFPIRDHNPSGRTPYVTFALIATNILIFLSYWSLMDQPHALIALYEKYALIPARPSLSSFVTSIFLHAGIWHLLGNMLFLWIFGDNLEDEMGHARFALFYLLSGILAGLVHVLLSQGSSVPTVGASGAIAGVMGGYMLLFPRARVDILLIVIIFFKIFSIPAWAMLALWFGIQLVGGVMSDPDAAGVAYWAHAGGFVIGAILAFPTWLRVGGSDFWSETRGKPPHPAAQYSRSNIPRVGRPRGNSSRGDHRN